MAATLGMVATIGYSLAAVFALLALTYYLMRHVRAVRDELTGRTAQREIAEMRAGRRGRSWTRGAGAGVPGSARASRDAGASSGSLHVRNVEAETNVVEPAAEGAAEAGTTLLGATPDAGAGRGADERGTTLLADGCPAAPDEAGTTLLDAGAAGPGAGAAGPAPVRDADEAGTTLLARDGEAIR